MKRQENKTEPPTLTFSFFEKKNPNLAYELEPSFIKVCNPPTVNFGYMINKIIIFLILCIEKSVLTLKGLLAQFYLEI
jgi:hypothetical protein